MEKVTWDGVLFAVFITGLFQDAVNGAAAEAVLPGEGGWADALVLVGGEYGVVSPIDVVTSEEPGVVVAADGEGAGEAGGGDFAAIVDVLIVLGFGVFLGAGVEGFDFGVVVVGFGVVGQCCVCLR